MITPVNFVLEDFIEEPPTLVAGEELPEDYWFTYAPYRALKMEDLGGTALIDNLLLLHFVEKDDVQRVMASKYKIPFTWINIDPTPADLRPLAEKYGVMFQRQADNILVLVPLGTTLDDAALGVDIPTHKLLITFIADCNYRILTLGMPANILSYNIADFRPLLVLRRLVADCKQHGSTDMHFVSLFKDKLPVYRIEYRVNRKLGEAPFLVDQDMLLRVSQAAIGKLSSASASDLLTPNGVTTNISDLYRDGTTELRLAGMPAEAGIYVVIAIQSVTTTTMTVDELGFPPSDVAIIRNLSKHRTGLTLVTGEMRSGKNTTIFAMLNEIIDGTLRIVEYSNPVENRMPIVQVDYKGDLQNLLSRMRLAKKMDIDIAVINEIPNSEVAFAVRDLVNSAIGVITTTHVNRVWEVPYKLYEFFGKDYKNVISSLNAVVNHKMFVRWHCKGMQRRVLQPEHGESERNAYNWGVRQYYVPPDNARVIRSLQPLTEIWVVTDEMRTAMLNYDELWRSEQMIKSHIMQGRQAIEYKLAQYINSGICPLSALDDLR